MNEQIASHWDEDTGLLAAWELDRKGGARQLQWHDLEHPDSGPGLRWIHLDFSKPLGKEWLQGGSWMIGKTWGWCREGGRAGMRISVVNLIEICPLINDYSSVTALINK